MKNKTLKYDLTQQQGKKKFKKINKAKFQHFEIAE